MAIASFRDLTLGYGSHAAVHHLSGALEAGSLTAVAGANGSGKSTLLKGLVGLIKPMSGSVALTPGLRMAYLPQHSEIDRSFPMRVFDLVKMGLWPSRGLLGRRTQADLDRVSAALTAVGLRGFDARPIDTLSGGQFQRALFARLLLQDAQLILLDEPFNAIDARTVEHLIGLIRTWHAEGRTVMAVLHDLDLARRHFPQTLLMAREPIAWGPTAEVLTPANLKRADAMDEAWDDDAPWCEGEVPHVHAHDHDHSHGHTHKHAAE